MIDNKIILPESQLPRCWYNVVAELPFDVPRPLHPIEDRGVAIEDYEWLWPRECLRIELQEGEYRYDWADYSELTPRILMYTLGHRFVPHRFTRADCDITARRQFSPRWSRTMWSIPGLMGSVRWLTRDACS